jgi:competence protein ComGC
MYCQKCGAENPDGTQSCQSCSAILDWSNSPAIAEPPKTSKLAIASLILGILSIFTCFITGIPAIITGVMSLIKINKSENRLKGLGLAVAGIAMPVIVIPIAAILFAIILPAFSKARTTAQRVACMSNMKSLHNAMTIYAQDYDGKRPTGSKWCDLLVDHANVLPDRFACYAGDESQSNFALNSNALLLGKNAPGNMVLIFESTPGWNQTGGPELLTTENHDGCNINYVDGSIQFVKTQDINKLRWK